MGFIPNTTGLSNYVPPSGDINSDICIIGEAPGAYELRERKPFVGPAGRVLEQCLHNAGLIRGELYLTNTIKHRITTVDKYYNERTKTLTPAGEVVQKELLYEIKETKANIIIPLGNLALACILGQGGIMSKRGYVTTSPLLDDRKVLPTIHPAAALRGQYIYRHFITADLRKAASESKTPFVIFPDVEITIPETYRQAMDYLEFLLTKDVLSIDIEVLYFETSCIGFCWEPNKAIVIPFYADGRYTVEQEIELWKRFSYIMYNENITKIGQNFIFDMQFLAQRNNIITRGYIEDTMIMNSLFHPDFPKSLEFLVSIHCNRPSWKHMVKWTGKDIVKKDN